jgi:hypothetical protein
VSRRQQLELADQIAALRASRPHDGRRVTMRETRGGWTYVGISGTCARISADGSRMLVQVENDPDDYWKRGEEILVEVDDESVPVFDEYS